ncbi:E3 ubiquitin-protein ligase RING1 [Euphorbia peplus]|nr:E3 ubiquitin-protein ligase RING1 [Euphorbia peplus]
MPSQKRPYDSLRHDNDKDDHDEDSHDEDRRSTPPSDTDHDDAAAAAADDDESPGTHSSSSDEEDDEEEEDDDNEEGKEYVVVKLAEIRKEVQCPICLGIIRNTRTVMECLHRFCRECIDKSMRLGNKECPACRTHCASRRSLRDDPNYDALIAALYPDIDKYEEEELAFHEEEKARNKQIQASIAQTISRQAEALGGRKRSKTALAAFTRRTQSRQRGGRRSYRTADLQMSDDTDDANGDGGKDSSSAEEQSPEVKPKRYKRCRGARSIEAHDENDAEVNREPMGSSAALVGPSERLAWGKNGMRSHTRYGSANSGNGKSSRNSRIHKLADYLRNLEENDNELDIHLMLVPLDERIIPRLQKPYLCCRPTLSVEHLCQYVALQTDLQPDEIEMCLVKELNSKPNLSASTNISISKASVIDPSKDKLQVLEEQETLSGLKTYNFVQGNLILVYQLKLSKLKTQRNSDPQCLGS